MTTTQYRAAVDKAANYTDRDVYISDLALSTVWGDSENFPIPAQRLEDLGQIWDAVNRDVKQIAAAAGLSCRKLAERFCLPYRTMESWSGGQRECSVQIRLMMQQVLGLLTVDIQ